MNDYVIFALVALVVFVILQRFVKVKVFKSEEEFLKYKEMQQNISQEEDLDNELDGFVDKNTFRFFVAGIIATLLFLICGFFTGNVLYLYIMLFIFTAFIFVACFPPAD